MNTKTLLLAAAAAVFAAGAARAGTLTLIPPDPLATSTGVLGINNAGWMTGSVVVDGQDKGYIRDPAGNYTTFSVNTSTNARGIDNSNNVYGYATDSSQAFKTDSLFVRAPDGSVTTLINPNTNTPLHGIFGNANASGVVVGDYISTPTGNGPDAGFILDGTTLTTIQVAGAGRTAARGIEDDGTVAGWAVNAAGLQEGFLDVGGTITTYQDPNATANNEGTLFENINNNGLAVGMWVDSSGNDHAFEFNSITDVFAEISVPGFTDVETFGVNDHGDVVLEASNSDISRNYVFNANGVPEPATWAMMLTGFFGLGSVLRRRRAALTA
jgi:hypothetical protein